MPEHHQAVGFGGLGGAYRSCARIARGGHRGHGPGGAEVARRNGMRQRLQELRALLQALGMRQDPAQRAQRNVLYRGQAVVDLPGFLTGR